MTGREETFALNARNHGSATAGICDGVLLHVEHDRTRSIAVIVRKEIGCFRFEVGQNLTSRNILRTACSFQISEVISWRIQLSWRQLAQFRANHSNKNTAVAPRPFHVK